MGLVTLRASHTIFSVFIAKQVRRTLKLRLAHVAVTLKTGLRLRSLLQHFGFGLHARKKLTGVSDRDLTMRAVTTQTGKPCAFMLTTPPHRMLIHLRVARLAVCAGFRCPHLHWVLDLRRITLSDMGLSRTMTSLAACHLAFPIARVRQLRMRCVREVLELSFVTVFAGITSYVFIAGCLGSGFSINSAYR